MSLAHLYEVDIHWNHDRKGTMSSPGLNDIIEVATLPEFPKGMAGIWSPEHLFVAAINSCLMTTFLAIAENSNLEFIDFQSSAKGKLAKVDGQFMISEITLAPVVTLVHQKDQERALRILEKSEAACLISNSTRARIILKPRAVVGEPAP